MNVNLKALVIWMMSLLTIVVLAAVIISASIVIKNLRAAPASSAWPEGLKDCQTYQVQQGNKELSVIRCPNSSVSIEN